VDTHLTLRWLRLRYGLEVRAAIDGDHRLHLRLRHDISQGDKRREQREQRERGA
jgi:hypothetical protein